MLTFSVRLLDSYGDLAMTLASNLPENEAQELAHALRNGNIWREWLGNGGSITIAVIMTTGRSK